MGEVLHTVQCAVRGLFWRENHNLQSKAQTFSAEALIGQGGEGLPIVCSMCQILLVACCFMPRFPPPESVPHSFLLFSSMPPPHYNLQSVRRVGPC